MQIISLPSLFKNANKPEDAAPQADICGHPGKLAMTDHVLPLWRHVSISPISQPANNLCLSVTASGYRHTLMVDNCKRAIKQIAKDSGCLAVMRNCGDKGYNPLTVALLLKDKLNIFRRPIVDILES